MADLVIDPVRARVCRDGLEIPLPRLSYDMLMTLIACAPGIATTDMLLERVWPGLVVNPETVSQRVKLLRTALGDDPRQPRYIAVIRGRGYRLIAPVRHMADSAAPVTAQTEVAVQPALATGAQPRVRRITPTALALICGVILLVAVLYGWQTSRQPNAPPQSARSGVAQTERSIAVLPFQNLGGSPDGEVLALGVAETVLHQLANLQGIAVIARTSSFALDKRGLDARSIGQRLDAGYLLEGSVQRVATQLRVTAQLIDTRDGAHVWSLQFDRSTRDIFAVQDEIALKVAQALELSLDATTTARLSGRGTMDFDAYLEYLQARSLLADGRVTDLNAARNHLTRAIRLDADFARAYVDLASTELRLAEFEFDGDRRTRFEAARTRAGKLLEQAIALDSSDGYAYLQRAYLMAFTDLDAAERDYRRGLALSPNEAAGYDGLAKVLYQNPRRHDEALLALDRARRLDPLDPSYDVARAGLLFYSRADVRNATTILERTIAQHPQYAPALARLGELTICCGNLARGIRFLELALQQDPSAEWPRRELISGYLEIGDPQAAARTATQAPGRIPARDLPLQLYRREWQKAGETAYAALDSDTMLAFDENTVTLALRRHARATGELEPALAALEQLADLRWTAEGEPAFAEDFDMKSAVLGVADLLLLGGQKDRGRVLLQRILSQTERATRELQRGAMWTRMTRAQALALLGDREGAIALLEESERDGSLIMKHWMHLHLDPAFDSLRGHPKFQHLVASMNTRASSERDKLEQLRRDGLIPGPAAIGPARR
jgi:TolB-like protein/DNA-binding winged helix-turn-helix (wHTH) protein/Tfp pilus assembly protein PilF